MRDRDDRLLGRARAPGARPRRARRADAIPDSLLLLEHPPVFTRGRRSEPDELPHGPTWYEERGVEIVDVRRGGKVTYHGPGQMIAYPIVRVGDVIAFVRLVERAAIAALAEHGIDARGRADEGRDFTGVWVGERKIGSIGLHVSGQVTTHGLAVNVDNDLEPFSWIVPCGLPDAQMTSIALESESPPTVSEFGESFAAAFAAEIGERDPPHQPRAARAGIDSRPHRLGWKRWPTSSIASTRPAPGPIRAGWMCWRCSDPTCSRCAAASRRGSRSRRRAASATRSSTRRSRPPTSTRSARRRPVPNVGECWERGTATFMILGDTCTRRCGFCNVKTGKPTWNDPLEPARVARQVAMMGLRHAVITSVDRDDLPDKGAGVWVGTIRQLRNQAPDCKVEVLTPDFQGQEMPLAKVIDARPDVFNHNVEVVPRLYSIARRGSRWERSLRVLSNAKAMGGDEVVTKSGLMVGLGETRDEVLDALRQLRDHKVQVITIGQYLRPTERHLPVVRYWHPDEFDELARLGHEMGFDHVASGPLVRSSYHADEHVKQERPGIGPLAA